VFQCACHVRSIKLVTEKAPKRLVGAGQAAIILCSISRASVQPAAMHCS
jgi:hypothetical protein